MRSLRPVLLGHGICRDDFVVVVGGMREGAAPVAVAERPDAFDIGAKFLVDHDEAVYIRGNPRRSVSQAARLLREASTSASLRAFTFFTSIETARKSRRRSRRPGARHWPSGHWRSAFWWVCSRC